MAAMISEQNGLIASVIVVCLNGRAYLDNCLNAVLDQELPPEKYEVLLVDNNSSDGSADYVEQKFPRVRVVRYDHNYGYYEAFNRTAASLAQGKYLIPLPQDTIVHRKWLSELTRVAESDDQALICLVNSINPTTSDFPEKEREAWPEYVYLMGTTRLGQTHPKKWPFSPDIVPVLTYSGVSALLKRDILTKTGYFFDSGLSHFIGDADLGLRVSVLGYTVVLVPTAVVYHVEDNKSWLDIRLLLRALLGARDYIVAYYRNMYGLEFLLFLPFLLLGVPLKAFALRSSLWQRILLFLVALPMSPLALLMAAFLFPRYVWRRREVLSKRRTGKFWLLRTIWTGDRL
jgi:GT2 family glycosyltransferase